MTHNLKQQAEEMVKQELAFTKRFNGGVLHFDNCTEQEWVASAVKNRMEVLALKKLLY